MTHSLPLKIREITFILMGWESSASIKTEFIVRLIWARLCGYKMKKALFLLKNFQCLESTQISKFIFTEILCMFILLNLQQNHLSFATGIVDQF